MATDLQLDNNPASPNYGDLLLDQNGALGIVDGPDTVRQRLLVRLGTFLGTWFDDPTFGVPYYQHVLGQSLNPTVLNSVFVDAILTTPGVARLTAPIQYALVKRVLTVSFTVQLMTGDTLSMSFGGIS
jgi:hypothetical protein